MSAVAIGNRIVTNGTIESVTITDPGLSETPPAVPFFSAWGLRGLVAILGAGGLIALRSRERRLGLRPGLHPLAGDAPARV